MPRSVLLGRERQVPRSGAAATEGEVVALAAIVAMAAAEEDQDMVVAVLRGEGVRLLEPDE